LPRGPELDSSLDSDPRIACFRQAANGLFVRMALLSLLATRQG
jgi:aspartate carbamoyltransferase catalytic subunit